MDLADVLWIGGATGAGKSSIARALASRHGLQLYNVDHRTYDHLYRSPPNIFKTLTQDQRWLLPSPVAMAARFVESARERLPLILEDLAALVGTPGAIAEGPFLLPSLLAPHVAAPDQALFLVPDEARQRETVMARGAMSFTSDPEKAREKLTRRNVLLAELIREDAVTQGLPVLEVDRPLAEMIELADERFAPALERVPRGGDLAAIRRGENDALANQARLYRASGDAPPIDLPLPFACECGAPGCADQVAVTLAEYETLSAAGDRSRLRAPRP